MTLKSEEKSCLEVLGIRKLQFFSAVIFSIIWSSKPWILIRIRIRIDKKCWIRVRIRIETNADLPTLPV
jgi:hypothetical protein